MDKVTLVKREVQASVWAERIRTCQSSGMAVIRWCEENSVNPKTYYYHLRRLREKVCEQIPVAVAVKAASGITVRIGEATADISDGTSAETIAAVIHALKC